MSEQADLQHNQQPFSVSELSTALKRTVEGAFSHVRVRGEISGFMRARSGHLYFGLKDADAVLDAVCFKGRAQSLRLDPEDGMEVICTGRLSTYAGRSKYQIIVETIELAGEGALLKLLEERRKRLAAEGLFNPERKRPIPYLPDVIGVVTSPTGAVIRDILHRLRDRFPRHVLVWPVLVQGEGAAGQVADAIRGFNAIEPGGAVPRPDLLIVARGGGSLEDLMAFNEEVVVRAAAESAIPLISAVGHETDTTLIDYASDLRAPTPTGAAEKAVPVRADLLAHVAEGGVRMMQAANRGITDRRERVRGLARGLPRADQLLETAQQRLDDRGQRHLRAMQVRLADLASRIARQHVPTPHEQIARRKEELKGRGAALGRALEVFRATADRRYRNAADRLTPAGITRQAAQHRVRLDELGGRLEAAAMAARRRPSERLEALAARLEAASMESVLKRGFALVRDEAGQAVTSPAAVKAGQALTIQFAGEETLPVLASSGAPAKPRPAKKPASPGKQEDLFG
jgi:exodeoxyribonuclease VII large subunit